MKLKTLNDLDYLKQCNLRQLGKTGISIFKELVEQKLKAEAVKDYKAIKVKKKKWTRDDVLNYIKWKNNLTEEDLK